MEKLQLKDGCHEHPLILKEVDDHNHVHGDEGDGCRKGPRSCFACKQAIFSGSFYTCSSEYCEDFVLHKLCAELPQEMENHPLHHPNNNNHPLTLIQYSWFTCNLCGEHSPTSFYYVCSTYNFRIDIICASMNEQNIQHPSHQQHPLFLLRKSILTECSACFEKHEGFFYHCRTCPQFYIHQNCASLPTSIKHSSSSHDDHPLTLAYSVPSEFLSVSESTYCDVCDKRLRLKNWVYCCVGCRYIAHANCATSRIEPFMSILLPWHENQMAMRSEVEEDDVIHLPVSDESVNLMSYFLLKDTTSSSSSSSLNDGGAATRNNNKIIINHFSHVDHPLILFDGQIHETESSSSSRGGIVCHSRGSSRTDDEETTCEACVRAILPTTPFYRCQLGCDFFLHKCCAELPAEIQHPFHPHHPLTLLPKRPDFFGLFNCRGCNYYCNGFTYTCLSCKYYYLDVTCASLPRMVKHESHPYPNHVLSLRDNEITRHCNACHEGFEYPRSSFHYVCDTCEFYLHPTCCVLFPKEIRHRYDEHPFVLTFSPVRKHFQDYYCEICEKILDPKKHFYHCACCDQSIHIKCLHPFDRWPNIKFGGTLTLENIHPHSLTLIPVIKDITRYKSLHRVVLSSSDHCSRCGSKTFFEYYGFAFKCFECNYKICRRCI